MHLLSCSPLLGRSGEERLGRDGDPDTAVAGPWHRLPDRDRAGLAGARPGRRGQHGGPAHLRAGRAVGRGLGPARDPARTCAARRGLPRDRGGADAVPLAGDGPRGHLLRHHAGRRTPDLCPRRLFGARQQTDGGRRGGRGCHPARRQELADGPAQGPDLAGTARGADPAGDERHRPAGAARPGDGTLWRAQPALDLDHDHGHRRRVLHGLRGGAADRPALRHADRGHCRRGGVVDGDDARFRAPRAGRPGAIGKPPLGRARGFGGDVRARRADRGHIRPGCRRSLPRSRRRSW